MGKDDLEAFRFELSRTLPVPISVGERNGATVLILRDGAVVDAGLVRALNDLTRHQVDLAAGGEATGTTV